MGKFYGYRCEKCNVSVAYSTGIGFLFPCIYEECIKQIKEGKWGEKYREFFEVFPNAATDAESGVYLCEHCGNVFNETNRGLYLPKDESLEIKPSTNTWCVGVPQIGKCYVTSYDLKKDYILYEAEEHKCPQCGKNAKLIEEEVSKLVPRCPKCSQEMKLESTGWWD